MYIALDGGHQVLSVALGTFLPRFFEIRLKQGDGLLHGASRLDHLWQKHFALSEEVAYHLHALHERALDDVAWHGVLL